MDEAFIIYEPYDPSERPSWTYIVKDSVSIDRNRSRPTTRAASQGVNFANGNLSVAAIK